MKNTNIPERFSYLKKMSSSILIPRILTNVFRTEEDILNLGNDAKKGFDSLNTTLALIRIKFTKIDTNQQTLNDNINVINDKVEENIEKINNKNDTINFYAYSENYPDQDAVDPFLKKSLKVSTGQVQGIIADEDSGIEITEINEDDKNIIKVNFDDTKLKGIKFVAAKNSSVKIAWDEDTQGYIVEQNDTLLYESPEPETEIILDHNLSSIALDIKVFKILDNDVNLKYPIIPGIEYPSDNQVRVYLTTPTRVHIVIARL